MFNIRRFASNSLDYSYFSKKYHNYDNFFIDYWTNYSDILAFNQCLSIWNLVSRFLSDLFGICNFSRKVLHLMIDVYVHHIWLCLTIIRLSDDIEENLGPKRNSNQSFLFVTGILTVIMHTTILKYPF